MQSFTGHKGPITSAVFGADGKKLITASEDGTVRIWNPKTGVADTVISGHNFHEGAINRLAIHPHNLNLVRASLFAAVCDLSNVAELVARHCWPR